jgi:prepilin-type N-terminal cleavage/methylation domain-containing protein
VLDRLRHEDDGFTLVETLAAMIVFAILAVSVGGTILHLFRLTEDNTARVVAANLATEQIEAARAKRALDVEDGAVEITPKPVVNGTQYTVVRTANYVAEDSATTLCETGSGSTRLAYKLVTVHVTWPNMGSVQPVRQDTLLALGLGFDGVDESKGTIAV